MIYDYLIAGVHLRCLLPFELHIEAESREFLLSEGLSQEAPDCVFSMESVERLPKPAEGYTLVNTRFCRNSESETVWHYPGPGREPYARILWQVSNPRLLLGQYLSAFERHVSYSGDIINLLSLESLLLRFDGLLLHAAFAEAEGKGILFAGPSGIGKSTQARLWQENCAARILNGDRAALRKKSGAWWAWGLPYAGSSAIYRNEAAPLAAIVLLEQSRENSLRSLGPSEALRRLYPELMLHRWDKVFLEKALDLAEDLLCAVPVWCLRCRPDAEAVEVLKETLKKEGRL